MSEVVEPIAVRMSALTAPIPGAQPSGVDLSFDTEFEQVKAEMDKLGSVAATPDWEKIINVGGKLLSGRTKDMRLGTWFCIAKMNKTGWAGLAEGLVVMRSLVTAFWDSMFPE